jgi:cytochrome c peroxidase
MTLEQQAIVPITGVDPVEMGMKGHEAEIAKRLSANSCYRKLFARAFPDVDGRIDLGTVARAVAAYQRTLISFDSAWDRAHGGGSLLDGEASRGETLFNGTARCASFHSGPNFSDCRLHRFAASARDRGAIRATGAADDDGRFRTPSLHNVALTAPYLHDGSAATIEDAITRLGAALPPDEMSAIRRFLDTLTDRTVTTDARFGLPRESWSTRL